MGCCSRKKSAKSKKTVSWRSARDTVSSDTVSIFQLKGGAKRPGGASASNKSKKAGGKPLLVRKTYPQSDTVVWKIYKS